MDRAMRDGLLLGRVRDAGRNLRGVEDVVAVLVGAQIVGGEGAGRGAGGHHRDLPLEGHEAFEDGGGAADLGPGGGGIGLGPDHHLALAVIAEAPGLEHGGPADPLERLGELGLVRDGREGGDVDAEAGDEALLQEPVLRHGQRLGVGGEQGMGAQGSRRSRSARSRTRR